MTFGHWLIVIGAMLAATFPVLRYLSYSQRYLIVPFLGLFALVVGLLEVTLG